MINRKTVYNDLTNGDKISKINEKNKFLINDFLDYLRSIDKAESTIKQYKSDLHIFFVWNMEKNNNKNFIDITKREFARFQGVAINEWNWSPKRTRRVKSVLSSLSNYIENMLDEEDEYKNYKSIVKKIENPINELVRDKSVFEPDELKYLLDMLVENKEYEKACCLALAMYSGRRKAELCRFKVSYFDESNVIFGSLYKTPEKVKTKGRSSKGKLIYLYVLKHPFQPYFDMWLNERNRLHIDSEWLFPDTTDPAQQVKISTLNSWARYFTRLIKKPFYFHSMRHFFTTECVKNNLPTNVIQEIIDWESADMVALYTDISTDETLGKYFDENGIKQIKQTNLSDL